MDPTEKVQGELAVAARIAAAATDAKTVYEVRRYMDELQDRIRETQTPTSSTFI